MDAARFDALARGLAATATRRVAGRVLAGIGLTGLLGGPVGAACIRCPRCVETFQVATARASPNDSCVF